MNNTPQKMEAGNTQKKDPIYWDIPFLFGIMMLLAAAELGFCVDTFQYKQKNHSWSSGTERARIAFLIFSCVRAICLSAVYIGFHFARKVFGSMHHTIFVVLSTIFWIISGVLIHSLYGLLKCGGVGPPTEGGVGKFKISECHELTIIEWLAWALAIVSVISAIPVLRRAWLQRKAQMKRKTHGNHMHGKTATSG